ncbi:MAG: tetratricopeptide repeat protein [Bacteroidales bacterium]|nr:tetratricopeptide repeat protein [Bacteroidales bacterium]
MKIPVSCLLLCLLFLASCHSGGDSPGGNLHGSDSTRQQLEVLNRQIEADVSNPVLYQKRARFFFLDRKFDNALKDVQKAISLDDSKSTPYIILSDIYLLMGKSEDSRDALNKAISKNPTDTDAFQKLAKLYLIMKDYKNCYATVKQLLAIDNGNASAYFTRAIALLEQGDTIRAVDDLKQAVDKNQEYYEAYIQLGELYAIKKDRMAELYLKNALTLRPKSREALYMLGLYYQETGKYDEAISTYQVLSKADTAFREASFNTGYIYLVYLKDFKKAAQFFSESLKKDPQYFEAYFNRGYACELAGDYQKAYDDYQKSLKIRVNYDKAIEGLNRLDKITRGE